MNNEIPKDFRHPGDHTFNECERTFKTSSLADGGILFYTRKNGDPTFINTNDNERELKNVCSDCPKYEGCLVHETLLNVLTLVKNKESHITTIG